MEWEAQLYQAFELCIIISFFIIPLEAVVLLFGYRRLAWSAGKRVSLLGLVLTSFIGLMGFWHLLTMMQANKTIVLAVRGITAVTSCIAPLGLFWVMPDVLGLPRYLDELMVELTLLRDFKQLVTAMWKVVREDAIVSTVRTKLKRMLPPDTLIGICKGLTAEQVDLEPGEELLTLPLWDGLEIHLKRCHLSPAQVSWLGDVAVQMRVALQQAKAASQSLTRPTHNAVTAANGHHTHSSSSPSTSATPTGPTPTPSAQRTGLLQLPPRTSLYRAASNCSNSSSLSGGRYPPTQMTTGYIAHDLTLARTHLHARTPPTGSIMCPSPVRLSPDKRVRSGPHGGQMPSSPLVAPSSSPFAPPASAATGGGGGTGGGALSHTQTEVSQQQHHQQQQQQQYVMLPPASLPMVPREDMDRLRMKCAGVLSKVLAIVEVMQALPLTTQLWNCVELINKACTIDILERCPQPRPSLTTTSSASTVTPSHRPPHINTDAPTCPSPPHMASPPASAVAPIIPMDSPAAAEHDVTSTPPPPSSSSSTTASTTTTTTTAACLRSKTAYKHQCKPLQTDHVAVTITHSPKRSAASPKRMNI